MTEINLTDLEKAVMTGMAHGDIREAIARKIHMRRGDGEMRSISPATVARHARSAAEKCGTQSIVHAIAILVSRGLISVKHGQAEVTAYKTALAWLDMRIHSCLTWQEFTELRDAWRAMKAEEPETWL